MYEGVKDNWDISARRATTIVRLLQTFFGILPDRIFAGERSEYQHQPKQYIASAAVLAYH